MFYQLIKYQKVPLYLMLKLNWEIVDVSLKPQELIAQSLDTPKMVKKPELDYPVDPEKLSLEPAELP